MAKRKPDDEHSDRTEEQQQGPVETAQPSADATIAVPDRMAAARAAKSVGGDGANWRKPKGSDIMYVIIGAKTANGHKTVVGMKRTRGQCRKQWDALREMALQIYDEVYILKCRRIEVDSL